jgi:excinuclease ABC subunit C
MKISATIQEKLNNLPSRPGVYLMRDRLGRVIYVGKAKDLNKRVRYYFQPARFSQLDPKTRALVEMAADLDTFEVRNEAEAILLEGKLIKEYRPKYNILFRDDKRFPLVKLTRDPFPRFVLTRLRKSDGCRYFGPFSNSPALRNTLDYILTNFHIRACPPSDPDERDYRHCHNDIIKHCSAPCVGRITREEYARWVERACNFLEGRDAAALEELEAAMQKAASNRDFEKAASLRDTLYDLRQTVHQSARKFVRDLPRRQDSSGELVALAHEFGLEKPPRVIEGFDVAHIHGQFAVGSMVQFVEGRPSRAGYRHFRIRGEPLSRKTTESLRTESESHGSVLRDQPLPSGDSLALNDDCGSIQEIVARRYRRLQAESKPLPDLVLVDGGRGQLNAAALAIEKIGIRIPLAGLAKEEEAIYLPNRSEPLKLPSDSPALQLLQRIRDESHRFANTFHESWRRKQIRSSILDELPGMGGKRKQTLLRRFGSVENLRKASLEEIRAVEGFGDKSAEILWRHLHP